MSAAEYALAATALVSLSIGIFAGHAAGYARGRRVGVRVGTRAERRRHLVASTISPERI